jgi:sugar phosphate permease
MAWASQMFACIVASSAGGYIVENSEARYSFYMYSAVSISVALTAYMMNRDLEDDDLDQPQEPAAESSNL